MRICLIGPAFPFRGGITHYSTLLYRYLRRNHETRFLCFRRQYPAWLFPGKSDKDTSKDVILEEGIEYVLDSLNPWTWVSTFSTIRNFRPHMVILPWWVSFWAPQFYTIGRLIRRYTSAKLLFICHNVVEHESNRIRRLLTRTVLENGHMFVVHSREDMKNLKRMLPKAEIREVFHPTYVEFPHKGISRDAARRILEVEGNVLLFFGFVRPYKGLIYLLEALPQVLANIPVTLLVVGEFWGDKAKYLEKVQQLGLNGAVRIVDEYVPNEEIEAYFKAADLLVMPYVSATGSGVVQLSFAFGTPVLVTNVGALPEVVKDGETGYVVPSGNSRAIAERILEFFRGGNQTEFRANVEADRGRFSWDNVVHVIEELATR